MLEFADQFPGAQSDQTIAQTLSENNACYVLITCGKPTPDGQINVEMMYGGDPILAAYLVQSASTFLENQL